MSKLYKSYQTLKLDLNNITFRQAYEILDNLKLKIEEVYK